MKLQGQKLSVVAAIAGVLLMITSVVFSQQGPPPGGGFRGGQGPGGPVGPFERELNLTDDQKAQIKKIADSFRESEKTLRDQLRTLHESEPVPASETFDEAAIRAAAEARAKIQVELEVSRAKMMFQITSLLTPEQRTQLAAKRKEFERQGPPPPPDRP
jgi:Spy/CpxP family protein refolding chaperone